GRTRCPAVRTTTRTSGSPSRRASWSGPSSCATSARSGSPVWTARCPDRSLGVCGVARSSSTALSSRASVRAGGPARPPWSGIVPSASAPTGTPLPNPGWGLSQPPPPASPATASAGEARLPALSEAAQRDGRVELAQHAEGPGAHPVDQEVTGRQVQCPAGPEIGAGEITDPLGLSLHPGAGEVERLGAQRVGERAEVGQHVLRAQQHARPDEALRAQELHQLIGPFLHR